MDRHNFQRVVKNLLKARPLRPFTIELTSGSALRVDHPEMVIQFGEILVVTDMKAGNSAFDHQSVARVLVHKVHEQRKGRASA